MPVLLFYWHFIAAPLRLHLCRSTETRIFTVHRKRPNDMMQKLEVQALKEGVDYAAQSVALEPVRGSVSKGSS